MKSAAVCLINFIGTLTVFPVEFCLHSYVLLMGQTDPEYKLPGKVKFTFTVMRKYR